MNNDQLNQENRRKLWRVQLLIISIFEIPIIKNQPNCFNLLNCLITNQFLWIIIVIKWYKFRHQFIIFTHGKRSFWSKHALEFLVDTVHTILIFSSIDNELGWNPGPFRVYRVPRGKNCVTFSSNARLCQIVDIAPVARTVGTALMKSLHFFLARKLNKQT